MGPEVVKIIFAESRLIFSDSSSHSSFSDSSSHSSFHAPWSAQYSSSHSSQELSGISGTAIISGAIGVFSACASAFGSPLDFVFAGGLPATALPDAFFSTGTTLSVAFSTACAFGSGPNTNGRGNSPFDPYMGPEVVKIISARSRLVVNFIARTFFDCGGILLGGFSGMVFLCSEMFSICESMRSNPALSSSSQRSNPASSISASSSATSSPGGWTTLDDCAVAWMDCATLCKHSSWNSLCNWDWNAYIIPCACIGLIDGSCAGIIWKTGRWQPPTGVRSRPRLVLESVAGVRRPLELILTDDRDLAFERVILYYIFLILYTQYSIIDKLRSTKDSNSIIDRFNVQLSIVSLFALRNQYETMIVWQITIRTEINHSCSNISFRD